ncbi:sulfotransferase family protein [Salipiger mangrovisoli]|uniref:Sulfotransferase family protein n=1 Tax=Salipiger mangrovisoli TaxID=2865933 RepID=A0ABR9WW53_9RHOB|nr:sulfotransferase family protein [Salipiger mangrovisoli]MBE9635519.1 sulfotransferase family protein [Salipiger mangrovisoli]
MTQKTFFLGLGGQKCGSTWIQAYLNRQQGSDFGRLGEYQVWEHQLGGVFDRYKVPQPPLKERLRARLKTSVGADEPAQHLRWRLQSDPETYFDYFAALLARPGITRTGDITPSYAALPPETLALIRDGFARRGITVKAIFSMRDPVDRLRSHMRMEMAKDRLTSEEGNAAPLRAFYATEEAAARSRYDRTIAAIEQAFAPEDRYLCLFEDLFGPEGIAALSGFAKVPCDPSQGGQAVNARAKGAGTLPEALLAEIAAHYRPAYEAAAARLPRVRDLWPSAPYALTSA